ncbi:hypothetical protein Tco_1493208 [Tanacetum coccineum]
MLVQPQTQADKDVEMPVNEEQPATISAPSISEPQGPRTFHTSYPLEQELLTSSPCSPLLVLTHLEVKRVISLVDETQRLDDDLIFDTTADLGGEEVVVKPAETGVSVALDVEVSAAEPVVTTFSLLVTTDSVTITAIEPTSKPKVVTTVPILNSATTVTTTKPKAKGITIQEPSITQKTAVSFISSSKGKAIMIESEKPMKIKDQITHDEQVAKDLHDKIQELAARMTLEEHEKYTVEDRARMLAKFIKNKKKQLAVERVEAIRNFEEIHGLYNKEKELVDTFVPIRSEEDEMRIKELNIKAEEESSNKDVDSTNKRKKRIRMKRSSKKQKTDADLKEEEQLKTFLSIVPNEEEVINYEVLDKRYQIIDWKSEFYHDDRYGEPHDYYRVFRADGSSRYIKTFTEMVSRFDRMDFLQLHSLVMQRFKTTTPEGIDLIL